MKIRWITDVLGTAPALLVSKEVDINFIDVRDMVDKAGNRSDLVRKKIIEGYDSLLKGKQTVVCCDYGISRSNAIAVGILAMYDSISFEEAVRRVLGATGENEIKSELLNIVRLALGESGKKILHEKLRILLTGASGFLGKPISQKLAGDYVVEIPDRNELDLRRGSTQLDLIVGEKEIDCIVHLANPRIYTSNIALGDTLTMLRNVLDVCVTRELRLIYLSGWEVYSGYRSSYLIADESMPLLPKGPYAETKYLCELLIEHSRSTQGLRCTMLRPSPVYGVGSDKPKFLYNFIDKIKRSQPINTHRYNNGLPGLDLLYLDDLVTAVSKSVASDFSGNLNIGTGVVTSTFRVAEILRGMLGGNNPIDSSLINTDTACVAMDSDKARQVLNWQPTINLEHGLQLILSNLNKVNK
jgi:nucleoside-diphosphate-sugar epimerase/predicted protein tyrosine phosphatase